MSNVICDSDQVEGMAEFLSNTYFGLGLFAISPFAKNLDAMLEADGMIDQVMNGLGLPLSFAVSVAVTLPIALVCMVLLSVATPVLFGGAAFNESFDNSIRG